MSLRVRIASFNVYNLVEEGVPFHGGRAYNPTQMAEKEAWIAAQLRRMKAVIVGFQEVYHREPLERAARASGFFVERQILTRDLNGEGPRVALASQFPVVDTESIGAFPASAVLDIDGARIPIDRFRHPVLRARLQLPVLDRPLSVFVAHLKSQRPLYQGASVEDPDERALGKARALIVRAAEAAALRQLVLEELLDDRPTVLIGDLNDSVGSVTTQIVAGDPPFKRLDKDRKTRLWQALLHSTHDIQARQSFRDVSYTHIHNGRHQTLDHILVSSHFARANPEALGYVEYLRHYNDHLVDETLSNDRQRRTESDHGQVVATLRFYDDAT